jgi:hypothetical protein
VVRGIFQDGDLNGDPYCPEFTAAERQAAQAALAQRRAAMEGRLLDRWQAGRPAAS